MEQIGIKIGFGAGCIFLIMDIVFFFLGKGVFSREVMSGSLLKDNILEELFGIGYKAMKLFRITFRRDKDKRLISKYSCMGGEKGAIRTLYYVCSGIITYFMLLLPSAIFLGIIADDLLKGAVVGGMVACVFSYLLWNKLDNIVAHKRLEIENELPGVVSKLILLMSSGMSISKAWRMIAESGKGKGTLYDEMNRTIQEMTMKGYLQKADYEAFADRCQNQNVSTLVSLLCQAQEKGTGEIVKRLEELLQNLWMRKENIVSEQVSTAMQTLSFPNILIFCGVLLLVLAPIFMEMGSMF